MPAEAFQHREELTKTIARAWAGTGTTVLTGVYSGDGGVGKTQLAVAEFLAAEARCDLRVWVNASSRSSVLSTYSHAYSLATSFVNPPEDLEREAKMFLAWLATTKRPWLVVLDDLAEPADLRGLWPQGKHGRTLVTTRRRDAALRGAGRVVVPIGVFTPAESLSYLAEKLAHTDAPDDALEQADALAADLGQLPVALAQAVAVLIDQGWSCQQYRAQFADRSRSLRDLFPADAPADEYDRTVATVWSLAVDRADRLAPGGTVRPILELASVLDPNGIPEEIWHSAAVLSRFVTGQEAAQNQAARLDAASNNVRYALRSLHRLSLITHQAGGGAQAVRIHALVQRVTLEQLSAAELKRVAWLAADALTGIWPGVERDPTLARILRQNTATLVGRMPDLLWEGKAHPVLTRYGVSLGEAGLVWQAAQYWEDMTDSATRLLGTSHPDCLAARYELARWRGEAGDPFQALTALSELAGDRERILGRDHPDTLTTRHERARWQGETGDASGAADALVDLLEDRARVLGRAHPDTLTTRHEVAYHRGEAGDAKGAADALAELLKDRLQVLGPDHADTLATRHDLARWRGQAGDAKWARAAFADLLRDRCRVLGPDHPETMRTEHNLAYWKGQAGDIPGAVTTYCAVLEHRLRVLGPDHPEILRTRLNLARWLGEAGDPAQSAAAFAELVQDYQRVLGPNNPQTLRARNNLARWLGEAGDPAGAAAAFAELVQDYLRVLGPDNPYTLRTRYSLARWLGEAGDPAGAAAALAELVQDYLRVLGPDNPYTLHTRRSLARWLGEAGDPAGAAAALAELVQDYLRVLGPDNPYTLRTRYSLARWLGEAGDPAGAAAALAELVQDYLRVLGPDNPYTLRTRRSLARWQGESETTAPPPR